MPERHNDKNACWICPVGGYYPSKSNSCKVVGTDCSGLRSKQGVKNKRHILKNKGFHFIQGPSMIHN